MYDKARKFLVSLWNMNNHRLTLVVLDTVIFFICGFILSQFSQFKEPVGSVALPLLSIYLFLALSRLLFGAYRRVWRYASSAEYLVLVVSDIVGGIAYLICRQIAKYPGITVTFSLAFASVATSCLANLTMRFTYKFLYRKLSRSGGENGEQTADIEKIQVAIVGAGTKGSLLAKELQVNQLSQFKPYCFIDHDPHKIGGNIAGLDVYSDENIVERLRKTPVKAIIIAVQALSAEEKSEVFEKFKDTGYKIYIYDVPHMVDGGEQSDAVSKPMVRRFNIEDLLFREPIRIDDIKTGDYYRGKVVMITGGGGSIGSELCRQIARFSPKRIVIFDIYENGAYDIQQEMKLLYGSRLDMRIEISSICEYSRVDSIMDKYRPDVVIHAAAHKHVPLMETNCSEAVKNNVFGTMNVVRASEKYAVKRFILISTDKAVNPTNVMGATKRVCEMIVQSRVGSQTEFAAVRFGNVLGSNGSVVPLFQRQIEHGGPVTITDKRITRFFMTIPEAAQLVLEAGVMAKNRELFVLNMGKSVKMLKLAEDMIRLSGYEPYKDIDIKEIGLREGEKLYEELLVRPDEMIKTENDLIFIERDKGLPMDIVDKKLMLLEEAVRDGGIETVKDALMEVVPTYHYPDEVNKQVV